MDDESREPTGSFPPRVLGRYELVGELASGGMATVYLARATGAAGFSRRVAIKKCHEHLAADEKFREMFLREARLAAQIHHPNVISTLDVVVDKDLYMVMEYVEGAPIDDLLSALGKQSVNLPAPIAYRVILDMLRGLHAAHTAKDSEGNLLGVVHRDISPQNLMIGIDGVTRIVDFGIAKAYEFPQVTQAGEIKGKIGYMAPEQFRSERTLSPATDVFSAAAVAWELLCGRPLFASNNFIEAAKRLINEPIPGLLENAVVRVPEALGPIFDRALDREQSSRTQSAKDFSNAVTDAGVRPATTDEAGAFIQSALAGKLREKRAMIRRRSRSSTTRAHQVNVAELIPETNPFSDEATVINPHTETHPSADETLQEPRDSAPTQHHPVWLRRVQGLFRRARAWARRRK